MADYRLYLQFAELHICTKAKEAADAWHEADVAGERDVTSFDELDDFVFLAVIFEFEVLGVVVEGGLRVVVQVHVDFVAHLTIEAEVNLLVEVKTYCFTTRCCKSRVVDLLGVDAHLEFCTTLCLDLHTTRTKDFLCRSKVEMHIRKVELALALCLEGFLVLMLPVLLHTVLKRPLLVFFWSHQDRRIQETGGCAQRIARPAWKDAAGRGSCGTCLSRAWSRSGLTATAAPASRGTSSCSSS